MSALRTVVLLWAVSSWLLPGQDWRQGHQCGRRWGPTEIYGLTHWLSAI